MNYKLQKLLLKILNWLDKGPNYYAFVDNVKVYSREFLEADVRYYKHKTIRRFLKDMDKMEKCMLSGKNCIMERGVVVLKDADVNDMVHEGE